MKVNLGFKIVVSLLLNKSITSQILHVLELCSSRTNKILVSFIISQNFVTKFWKHSYPTFSSKDSITFYDTDILQHFSLIIIIIIIIIIIRRRRRRILLFMCWILMFAHLSLFKVLILFLFSILLCQPIPFSLIPVVTSCIYKFWGILFLLLPVGHHSKIFRTSLSSSSLCTCPYQFNCINTWYSQAIQ